MATAPWARSLDWTAPWLADWQDPGLAVLQALHEGRAADLPGALTRLGTARSGESCAAMDAPPLPRFVPQSVLPAGQSYEDYIALERAVPTREGLHDFFNGLCWLRFARTKSTMVEWHARVLAERGAGQPTRGPLRDALTLLDENAALLHAPEPLWAALAARDWQAAFVGLRGLWLQARLVLFGHALLEKLATPYKAITAHLLVLPMPALPAPTAHPPSAALASAGALGAPHPWDGVLAQALQEPGGQEWLASKPYLPLPVLGVPGWWAPNADTAFYDDPAVFRRPRAVPITCTSRGLA